ncbi:MAG TPA: TIR domain-containing protein, partial [Ktedonobacterales bacterium]|nr:TIR domain-containing protein [Ktedonobacterales bacterium]
MSAATNRPTSVFISYSRVDSAAIDHLQAELISYGFATWVDRQHLEGGDVWAAGIERAIQGCDVVVVGLSPDAVASPWVTNELFYAHNLKKQIIPVVIRPVESIPLLLSAMQFIDMQADESQGLQQLRLRLLRLDEQTNVADFDLTAPVSHHLPPNPEEETSDPMAELVELPEPTPAIDSNELFIQGISALAHKNLDQAEALLLQVVDQDKNFGNGIAARKLGELQRQLLPHQLERLHFQAHQAELQGAWDEAVGAWSAYVERAPDDTEAQAALTRNQQNRDAAWLYVNAHILAQQQDWPAFCEMWELLREQAPGYGDPGSIYHPSVEPGTLLGACCDGANYVWSVAWSPDGRRLATA